MPDDIAAEIYSRSAKGILGMDMILYARKKGLQAIQSNATIEDIKGSIEMAYPVIVLVDYGFWVFQQNHFMVIVGYTEKGVIVNSGRDELKFVEEADFLKAWKRTNCWTLIIKPGRK